MTTISTGTNFANDQANGYVTSDGFGGPSSGAATFPNGVSVSGFMQWTPTVIAAAGSAQGNATIMTTSLVEVTATASTQGVKLASGLGDLVYVAIPGTVGAKVYPPTGGRIGTGATNAALAQVAGKSSLYAQVTSTLWVVLKGA